MSVKKIFITLITIVVCVILGAFVINTLMPNMVGTIINAAEGQIYRATGLSFDFNGDGTSGATTGTANSTQTGGRRDEGLETNGTTNNIDGFAKQS